MSGLYNVLFGQNPNAEQVLSLLNLKIGDVERFRDCSIDFEGKEIIILTRTGGGNRESYPNEILTSHPQFKYDEDDSFDSTYAYYYFDLPKES